MAAVAVFALSFGAVCLAPAQASAARSEAPPPKDFIQSGMASWYSIGTRTASGERYNPDGLSAAHRTLPFGTRILVSNNKTGESVVVTVNDRGPFAGGRIIDLSRGAARKLGLTQSGVARVTVQVTTEIASAE